MTCLVLFIYFIHYFAMFVGERSEFIISQTFRMYIYVFS